MGRAPTHSSTVSRKRRAIPATHSQAARISRKWIMQKGRSQNVNFFNCSVRRAHPKKKVNLLVHIHNNYAECPLSVCFRSLELGGACSACFAAPRTRMRRCAIDRCKRPGRLATCGRTEVAFSGHANHVQFSLSLWWSFFACARAMLKVAAALASSL
jgi:hypothetical protein